MPHLLASGPCTPVTLDELKFIASGLVRPECVLATRSGDLFTADWRGGVAHQRRDGGVELIRGALADGRPLLPNGIALRRDGSFLIAHLGDSDGGVFILERNGQTRPFLQTVDGIELPPSNFVHEDTVGRVWITVSTRRHPRLQASRPDVADGFIVLVDALGARVVADGLGYTNEALVSPDGAWLYLNETFARRLTRFRIGADGSLSGRETVTTFGAGTYADGLTFDADDGVWITSIVSNRVIRVARDGSTQLILEDCDAAHLAACEVAFQTTGLTRALIDQPTGRRLKNISSLAFVGADLRTAVLGCLLGDSLATFRTSVVGHPPVHWTY